MPEQVTLILEKNKPFHLVHRVQPVSYTKPCSFQLYYIASCNTQALIWLNVDTGLYSLWQLFSPELLPNHNESFTLYVPPVMCIRIS